MSDKTLSQEEIRWKKMRQQQATDASKQQWQLLGTGAQPCSPEHQEARSGCINPSKLELCRDSAPRFPKGQQDKLSSSAAPLIPPPQAREHRLVTATFSFRKERMPQP